MMRPITTSLCIVASYLVFGAALWFALTSSLDGMTQRDCQYGVQAACEALK